MPDATDIEQMVLAMKLEGKHPQLSDILLFFLLFCIVIVGLLSVFLVFAAKK